jgi:hypothetical protein
VELRRGLDERGPVVRRELPGRDQHERPDDLERVDAADRQQELHHASVEQRERELLVLAPHAERTVEVFVLELDVVEADRGTNARQDVLVPDPQRRAVGRDGHRRAGEAVVVTGAVAVRVGRLVVVPVVEHPHRHVVAFAPHHVLDAAPGALREQREGQPDGARGIVLGEGEPEALRDQEQVRDALALRVVLHPPDAAGDDQPENDERDERQRQSPQ